MPPLPPRRELTSGKRSRARAQGSRGRAGGLAIPAPSSACQDRVLNATKPNAHARSIPRALDQVKGSADHLTDPSDAPARVGCDEMRGNRSPPAVLGRRSAPARHLRSAWRPVVFLAASRRLQGGTRRCLHSALTQPSRPRSSAGLGGNAHGLVVALTSATNVAPRGAHGLAVRDALPCAVERVICCCLPVVVLDVRRVMTPDIGSRHLGFSSASGSAVSLGINPFMRQSGMALLIGRREV